MLSFPTLLHIFSFSTSVLGTCTELSRTANNLVASQDWGCSSKLVSSSSELKKCGNKGDFFFEYRDNQAICCSSQTRSNPPPNVVCPQNWGYHSGASCCIPPTEVASCDCGEGYSFSSSPARCVQNNGNCRSNEWYHQRSSTCCPNNPPSSGTCPTGKYCPSDWYWSTTYKTCKPNGPHSPGPDCGNDWSPSSQCCNHPSAPSPVPAPPSPPGFPHFPRSERGNHNSQRKQKHKKRANLLVNAVDGLDKRAQQVIQSAKIDEMYCPKPLEACTVAASFSSPEWAYECLNTQSELQSCGGCLISGDGVDCTSIRGSRSVGCEQGKCLVHSCLQGWRKVNNVCVHLGTKPRRHAL